MRRLPFLLLLAAPLALAQLAPGARTPEASGAMAKYHAAAKAYVDGENETAVREAEAGLALAPDNQKLKDLLDLLRKNQPPQDGDGEQDDRSESGEEGEQDQEGQNQQQNQPEGPEGDDEADRDGTEQDQPEPRDGQDRQRPQSPSSGQPRGAQMSQAEAQRLLDAVGADEELLVSRMRRPSRTRRPDRDW